MRTYEQTHPWISYRLDLRKVPASVWLLLGRAAALGERLGAAPMPPGEARALERRTLAEGVLASAALDGNTLGREEAVLLLEGRFEPPQSQRYLKVELENLVKAAQWTEDRIRSGDRTLTPWTIQMFNAQVLKGLPWDEDVRPGEWRMGGGAPNSLPGVPAEDLELVMDRLCDWLASPLFDPEAEEERHPMALVRAAMAHLYLVWAAPFAEGNGRTARLVEHQLLLAGGVPSRAALLPVIGLDRIRPVYTRLAAQCARTNDPLPFLGHWVRTYTDELDRHWQRIVAVQRTASWTAHLDAAFDPTATRHDARQRQLLMDLLAAPGPVPPGHVPTLSTALAHLYAPLHPKTLQRDIEALARKGFVVRTAQGVQAVGMER